MSGALDADTYSPSMSLASIDSFGYRTQVMIFDRLAEIIRSPIKNLSYLTSENFVTDLLTFYKELRIVMVAMSEKNSHGVGRSGLIALTSLDQSVVVKCLTTSYHMKVHSNRNLVADPSELSVTAMQTSFSVPLTNVAVNEEMFPLRFNQLDTNSDTQDSFRTSSVHTLDDSKVSSPAHIQHTIHAQIDDNWSAREESTDSGIGKQASVRANDIKLASEVTANADRCSVTAAHGEVTVGATASTTTAMMMPPLSRQIRRSDSDTMQSFGSFTSNSYNSSGSIVTSSSSGTTAGSRISTDSRTLSSNGAISVADSTNGNSTIIDSGGVIGRDQDISVCCVEENRIRLHQSPARSQAGSSSSKHIASSPRGGSSSGSRTALGGVPQRTIGSGIPSEAKTPLASYNRRGRGHRVVQKLMMDKKQQRQKELLGQNNPALLSKIKALHVLHDARKLPPPSNAYQQIQAQRNQNPTDSKDAIKDAHFSTSRSVHPVEVDAAKSSSTSKRVKRQDVVSFLRKNPKTDHSSSFSSITTSSGSSSYPAHCRHQELSSSSAASRFTVRAGGGEGGDRGESERAPGGIDNRSVNRGNEHRPREPRIVAEEGSEGGECVEPFQQRQLLAQIEAEESRASRSHVADNLYANTETAYYEYSMDAYPSQSATAPHSLDSATMHNNAASRPVVHSSGDGVFIALTSTTAGIDSVNVINLRINQEDGAGSGLIGKRKRQSPNVLSRATATTITAAVASTQKADAADYEEECDNGRRASEESREYHSKDRDGEGERDREQTIVACMDDSCGVGYLDIDASGVHNSGVTDEGSIVCTKNSVEWGDRGSKIGSEDLGDTLRVTEECSLFKQVLGGVSTATSSSSSFSSGLGALPRDASTAPAHSKRPMIGLLQRQSSGADIRPNMGSCFSSAVHISKAFLPYQSHNLDRLGTNIASNKEECHRGSSSSTTETTTTTAGAESTLALVDFPRHLDESDLLDSRLYSPSKEPIGVVLAENMRQLSGSGLEPPINIDSSAVEQSMNTLDESLEKAQQQQLRQIQRQRQEQQQQQQQHQSMQGSKGCENLQLGEATVAMHMANSGEHDCCEVSHSLPLCIANIDKADAEEVDASKVLDLVISSTLAAKYSSVLGILYPSSAARLRQSLGSIPVSVPCISAEGVNASSGAIQIRSLCIACVVFRKVSPRDCALYLLRLVEGCSSSPSGSSTSDSNSSEKENEYNTTSTSAHLSSPQSPSALIIDVLRELALSRIDGSSSAEETSAKAIACFVLIFILFEQQKGPDVIKIISADTKMQSFNWVEEAKKEKDYWSIVPRIIISFPRLEDERDAGISSAIGVEPPSVSNKRDTKGKKDKRAKKRGREKKRNRESGSDIGKRKSKSMSHFQRKEEASPAELLDFLLSQLERTFTSPSWDDAELYTSWVLATQLQSINSAAVSAADEGEDSSNSEGHIDPAGERVTMTQFIDHLVKLYEIPRPSRSLSVSLPLPKHSETVAKELVAVQWNESNGDAEQMLIQDGSSSTDGLFVVSKRAAVASDLASSEYRSLLRTLAKHASLYSPESSSDNATVVHPLSDAFDTDHSIDHTAASDVVVVDGDTSASTGAGVNVVDEGISLIPDGFTKSSMLGRAIASGSSDAAQNLVATAPALAATTTAEDTAIYPPLDLIPSNVASIRHTQEKETKSGREQRMEQEQNREKQSTNNSGVPIEHRQSRSVLRLLSHSVIENIVNTMPLHEMHARRVSVPLPLPGASAGPSDGSAHTASSSSSSSSSSSGATTSASVVSKAGTSTEVSGIPAGKEMLVSAQNASHGHQAAHQMPPPMLRPQPDKSGGAAQATAAINYNNNSSNIGSSSSGESNDNIVVYKPLLSNAIKARGTIVGYMAGRRQSKIVAVDEQTLKAMNEKKAQKINHGIMRSATFNGSVGGVGVGVGFVGSGMLPSPASMSVSMRSTAGAREPTIPDGGRGAARGLLSRENVCEGMHRAASMSGLPRHELHTSRGSSSGSINSTISNSSTRRGGTVLHRAASMGSHIRSTSTWNTSIVEEMSNTPLTKRPIPHNNGLFSVRDLAEPETEQDGRFSQHRRRRGLSVDSTNGGHSGNQAGIEASSPKFLSPYKVSANIHDGGTPSTDGMSSARDIRNCLFDRSPCRNDVVLDTPTAQEFTRSRSLGCAIAGIGIDSGNGIGINDMASNRLTDVDIHSFSSSQGQYNGHARDGGPLFASSQSVDATPSSQSSYSGAGRQNGNRRGVAGIFRRVDVDGEEEDEENDEERETHGEFVVSDTPLEKMAKRAPSIIPIYNPLSRQPPQQAYIQLQFHEHQQQQQQQQQPRQAGKDPSLLKQLFGTTGFGTEGPSLIGRNLSGRADRAGFGNTGVGYALVGCEDGNDEAAQPSSSLDECIWSRSDFGIAHQSPCKSSSSSASSSSAFSSSRDLFEPTSSSGLTQQQISVVCAPAPLAATAGISTAAEAAIERLDPREELLPSSCMQEEEGCDNTDQEEKLYFQEGAMECSDAVGVAVVASRGMHVQQQASREEKERVESKARTPPALLQQRRQQQRQQRQQQQESGNDIIFNKAIGKATRRCAITRSNSTASRSSTGPVSVKGGIADIMQSTIMTSALMERTGLTRSNSMENRSSTGGIGAHVPPPRRSSRTSSSSSSGRSNGGGAFDGGGEGAGGGELGRVGPGLGNKRGIADISSPLPGASHWRRSS